MEHKNFEQNQLVTEQVITCMSICQGEISLLTKATEEKL